MANTKNQDDKKKGGINPAVAVATGAVIGAGIAAAGAYALKDKKNRDAVKNVFNNVKDQAMEMVENLQDQAGSMGEEMKGKLIESKPKSTASSSKRASKSS